MATNLNKVAITTETIAQKIGKRFKLKDAAAVSSKLTHILKKIGFGDNEIKMFMSDSANDGIGRYIFNCSIDVIEEFFTIIGKSDLITIKEKNRLEECLSEMLPIYKKVEDYEKLLKLDEDSEEYKTERDELLAKDNKSYGNINKIYDIVNNYYINCVVGSIDFFEKRIFVSVDCAQKQKNARRRVYQLQYELILRWSLKWNYVMDAIERLRSTEDFDNRYEVCIEIGLSKEERAKIFNTGINDWKNECAENLYDDLYVIDVKDMYEYISDRYEEPKDIQADITDINKEKCLEKCGEVVRKINNHALREAFKDDYKYLIEKAFEELEIIRQKVLEEEKKEYYYSLLQTPPKNDFEELYKIREAAKNKRKSIMDYKNKVGEV